MLVQEEVPRVFPVNTHLADRINMAFMGTYVVSGKGVDVVVATGMNTVIGRMSEEISRTQEERILDTKKFTRISSIAVVLTCVKTGSLHPRPATLWSTKRQLFGNTDNSIYGTGNNGDPNSIGDEKREN